MEKKIENKEMIIKNKDSKSIVLYIYIYIISDSFYLFKSFIQILNN